MATLRQDRLDDAIRPESCGLRHCAPPNRVAPPRAPQSTPARFGSLLSRRSNPSRLFRVGAMGACGSKEIAGSQVSRDLSRWKADDIANEGADALAGEGQQHAPRSGLTMNAVVAIFDPACPSDREATDLCFTGWEDGIVQLQDWRRKRTLAAYKPHSRAVNRIVVGPKTSSLFTCSRDTTVAITTKCGHWQDSQAESPPSVLSGHSLNVSTIALDDGESTLCSGGRDTQTVLWDLATAQAKSKNTTAQNVITCSKWIPRERVVAQGSEDLSVKLWDERNGLRAPVQALCGYVYFPLCLDISSDGLYILTSSKGFNGVGCEVRVWDRRMGRQLIQYEGHQQDATACCFLYPNSQRNGTEATNAFGSAAFPTAASASKDGTVKIWDSTSKRVLYEAHEPSGRMFTSVSWAGGVILGGTLLGDVHAFEVDTAASTLNLVE